ncbi:MAG: FHA domain-containing protein [Nannocystaceae bacterium]|nr:FHA domain-containing protein [Nannocystaceae bacterium]
MIRLSVSEQGAPPRLVTFDTSAVHVGRAGDCELCLGGTGVSSRHSRFSQTAQGIVVEDLGSTNGTFVNRQRIQGPVAVTARDEVIVGMYEIRLHQVSTGMSAAPPVSHAPMGPGTANRQPTGVMPPQFAAQAMASAPSVVATGPMPSTPPASGASPAVNPSVDPDWARQWEKLDSLARGWIAAGKDRKRLLRAGKLSHARKWLASGKGKTPVPKREHRDFIFASSRARQMRVVRNVTLGGLVLSVGVVGAIKISQIVGDDDGREGAEITTADPHPGDVATPKTGGDAGRDPLAQIAANAAASAEENDPTLAVLLATAGLDASSAEARGTSVELVFRSAIGKLQGKPLRGHDDPITDAAFSPDGHWSMTASKDGSVRLWDRTVVSRRPISLRGHSRGVLDVLVTPDSKFLFTSGENGKVLRWDLGSSEVMSNYVSLPGHSTAVGNLAVSRDGQWLVSGSADGSVRVWNASSPVPKSRKFPGHDAPIRAVAINSNGSKVLAASQDGTASIWTSNAGAPGRRTVLEGGSEEEPAQILDIEISADGEWVLTGHSNGAARLWDPSRRIPKLTALTMEGHEGAVSQVAFTPDSTLAITAGDDKKLRIWNLEAKNPSLSAPTFDLHEGRITDLVTVSDADPAGPRRRLAATASEDGTVRTWNLERRDHEQDSKVFAVSGGKATAVALSSDGQAILGGSSSGEATLWPAQSPAPPGASSVGWGHTKQVLAIAVNTVGTRMVSASADGTAKLWDLTKPGRAGLLATLAKNTGQVVSVAVSPSGKFVATGDSNGAIRLWDITKADPAADAMALDLHRRGVQQMAFSKDGARLISLSSDMACVWTIAQDITKTVIKLKQKDELVGFAASDDGRTLLTAGVKELRLYDLAAPDVPASAKALRRAHGLDVLRVGISPDGRWAASSAKDATLVLWDLANGAKALEILLHEKPVDAIAFSPDGRWLATGSQDTTNRLWDLKAKQPNRRSAKVLEGSEQRISALRWSADSHFLVGASNDQTIRVYDMRREDPAGGAVMLTGHTGLISGIDLSEDATLVVSASYDLTARAWPLTAGRLVSIGCARAGRSLTPDEWSEAFGDAAFRRVCG